MTRQRLLDDDVVRAIWYDPRVFAEIAREFRVPSSVVSQIKRRGTYRDVTDGLEPVERKEAFNSRLRHDGFRTAREQQVAGRAMMAELAHQARQRAAARAAEEPLPSEVTNTGEEDMTRKPYRDLPLAAHATEYRVLTDEQARAAFLDPRINAEIARDLVTSSAVIKAIKQRRTYRDVTDGLEPVKQQSSPYATTAEEQLAIGRRLLAQMGVTKLGNKGGME